MSGFWSRGIADLETYVPGEQPRDSGWIKLNTNENPYPPSPLVIEAIRGATDARLRLYPDPTCDALRSAIAAYHGVAKEGVFVGNGSDEILAFAFAAFFDHGDPVLFSDITYSFYPVYANFFRLEAGIVPVGPDFSLPVEPFLRGNGGIVLSNPNAPTSMGIPLADILRLLDHNLALGRAVVVDEAYVDFGGESALPLLGGHPNLLVVRTLSKSRSLAGLRIGYAIGSPELVEGLERVKSSFNSYTLDRLALAGAVAAMEDEAYFQATRARIIATREAARMALEAQGFSVLDSKANFLFASHRSVPAAEIFAALRERKVLVRYFRKPRIDNHLRISVGTDLEMDALVEATASILRGR